MFTNVDGIERMFSLINKKPLIIVSIVTGPCKCHLHGTMQYSRGSQSPLEPPNIDLHSLVYPQQRNIYVEPNLTIRA